VALIDTMDSTDLIRIFSMNFTDAFQSLLGKKNTDTQIYLSLFVDEHSVAASFWRPGARGAVERIVSAHKGVPSGIWKDRITSIDALLGHLEEKGDIADVTTTILGLSPSFLTSTGEIRKEVRLEIKKLAQELALTVAGFVPLTQAAIYKLKTDEGVPPSVILLGINASTIALSLYKIGTLVGVRDIDKHEDVATQVEQGLKSFTEMEVLPARILLYGSDEKALEEVKTKLLHHPWTTKANFLHFPKIEIITQEFIVDAISLAGASEMKASVPDAEEEQTPPVQEEKLTAEAVVPPPAGAIIPESVDTEDNETLEAQADVGTQEIVDDANEKILEDTQTNSETIVDETRAEVAEAQEILKEDFALDNEPVEDANVVMVDAESLGFRKNADILEEKKEQQEKEVVRSPAGTKGVAFASQIGYIARGLQGRMSSIRLGKINPIAIVALIALLLVGGLFVWTLPKATVTVLEIPRTLTASENIIIDPTVGTIDGQSNTVPGTNQQKSLDGEKTVAVVGKKDVGDPARGTVTIYNKALSARSLKKGTVLSSGSLKFTLDSDTEVASASESIGSITFGKKDAAVTASAIGGQSNLPGGTEFSFADMSNISARNDNALTGGTSRQVTVVTRSDVDTFVNDLSDELTQKAQEDLASSVSGGEQMIEDTIKTTVTERVFDQEIDQESNELHGKITITVSGITYAQKDIRDVLTQSGALEVPEGYTLSEDNTKISLSNVQVKKDGTITAKATVEAQALPTIDISALPAALAGKTIKDAEMKLRAIPGVGGMQVGFRFSLSKNRLPLNRKNISVSMSVVE
jgi:hypothetical protein